MSIQLVSFESTGNVLCMFVLSPSTPAGTEPLIPLMFPMSLIHELCRYLAGCRLEKLHGHDSPFLSPDHSSCIVISMIPWCTCSVMKDCFDDHHNTGNMAKGYVQSCDQAAKFEIVITHMHM